MKTLAILFFILSLFLVAFGFNTMYHYGNYDEKYPLSGDKSGHVVGGDAYNFIIIGVRGLGYIIAGLIAAIFGGVSFLASKISERQYPVQSQTISNETTI